MTWPLTYCWDISLRLHHITSIINNSLVEFILGASGRVFSMYWRWMAFIHVPSLVAECWRFPVNTITEIWDESERGGCNTATPSSELWQFCPNLQSSHDSESRRRLLLRSVSLIMSCCVMRLKESPPSSHFSG